MRYKLGIPGVGTTAGRVAPKSTGVLELEPMSRRMAMVSDGRDPGAPLEYAIDDCNSRHGSTCCCTR